MTRREDHGPPSGLSRAEIETAVSAATRAPSILNCQPWRFHARGDVIDVSVDPDRSPGVLDPSGREVLLSVGAAVFNLRLALAALGREPLVSLMPDPQARRLAARVRLGGRCELTEADRELRAAVDVRRSSRQPFTDVLVPAELVTALQEAALVEGSCLDPATGSHRRSVLGVLHEADREQRADPAVLRDVARWTGSPDARVGISGDSLGPRPRDPGSPVRDLGLGTELPGRGAARFEQNSLLAVLLTATDTPVDWLRGGMALERVLLTAAAAGLAVGILSHGTEVADLRPLMRDPESRWRYPQLVLRLGYPVAPMPASPRLPLPDVLTYEAVPAVAAEAGTGAAGTGEREIEESVD